MIRRPAIGAEGSAGPEGGRKAPALHAKGVSSGLGAPLAQRGGSGAARRYRRAVHPNRFFWVLGTATVLATLSTQALAGLSTDTLKVCEKAKAYGPALVGSLESIGWNTLEKKHWKRFERRAIDGFGLLYMGHGVDPLVWKEVKKRGQSYTSAVKKWISSSNTAMAFVDSDNPDAVLVVLNMANGGQQGFECVYAGPSDKKTDARLKKLVGSFDRKGIKQENSEAHIAYGEYNSTLGTPPRRAKKAIQIARYLEPMIEVWGRPARVETAYFVQKQTKK